MGIETSPDCVTTDITVNAVKFDNSKSNIIIKFDPDFNESIITLILLLTKIDVKKFNII